MTHGTRTRGTNPPDHGFKTLDRHIMYDTEPIAATRGPAGGQPDVRLVRNFIDGSYRAGERWFDKRSGRLVGATAAGVEAMLEERQTGNEPHQEAAKELVEQIRRELAAVSRIVLA